MTTSRFSDRDVLAYDMFAGDRDCDVTVFDDRMVVARKPHTCVVCQGPIAPNERHRARREKENRNGVVMTFRACALCCEAMAASWFDEGRAITERTWMGRKEADGEAAAIDAAATGPLEEGPF